MNVHVSPSLQAAGRWANEVKFLVSPDLAEQVLEWARASMVPDCHGDPDLDGAYLIHTLYLDTAERSVYLRDAGYRVSKFRVRHYGDGKLAYVEQKRKRGCRVLKRREPIALNGIPPEEGWFAAAIERRRLGPSVLVSYTRHAFNAMTPLGPIRMTLDRDLNACAPKGWVVAEVSKGIAALADARILEIKFPVDLPQEFRELIQRFGLVQGAMSKYRLAFEALSLASDIEVKSCQSF